MSPRNFNELRRQVEARPGARERLSRYRRELDREISLSELRRARNLTQNQLARSLEITQPAISRIERQTDLYLTTLRSYVEALGGELELRVVFPDRSISIETVESLDSDPDDPSEHGPRLTLELISESGSGNFPNPRWQEDPWAAPYERAVYLAAKPHIYGLLSTYAGDRRRTLSRHGIRPFGGEEISRQVDLIVSELSNESQWAIRKCEAIPGLPEPSVQIDEEIETGPLGY